VNAGAVLRESAAVYTRSFTRYALLAAIVLAPANMLTAIVDPSGEAIWPWLAFALVAYPLATGAVTVAVATDRPQAVREAYAAALRRLPRLIVATFAASALILAGLVLLVVPGLIALARLVVVVPVVVLEEREVGGIGVARSWELGRGATLPLLWIALVSLAATTALPVIFGYAIADDGTYWAAATLSDILLVPFAAIAATRAYVALRERERERERAVPS
jgi:hypothetical protein